MQDGSNWSLGQRHLFCLGITLLKRRNILILDEATTSIDNATDTIIHKTIPERISRLHRNYSRTQNPNYY